VWRVFDAAARALATLAALAHRLPECMSITPSSRQGLTGSTPVAVRIGVSEAVARCAGCGAPGGTQSPTGRSDAMTAAASWDHWDEIRLIIARARDLREQAAVARARSKYLRSLSRRLRERLWPNGRRGPAPSGGRPRRSQETRGRALRACGRSRSPQLAGELKVMLNAGSSGSAIWQAGAWGPPMFVLRVSAGVSFRCPLPTSARRHVPPSAGPLCQTRPHAHPNRRRAHQLEALPW
jgi:hypothetical protein